MVLSSTIEFVIAILLIGLVSGWALIKLLNEQGLKNDKPANEYKDSDELIDWYFNICKINDFSTQRKEMAYWKNAAEINHKVRHQLNESTKPKNVSNVLEYRAKNR